MKVVCVLILLIFTYVTTKSQSCTIPQPLTEEQKEMVKGEWSGYYELDGVKAAFKVSVDFNIPDPVQVSRPPLKGDATGEEYRFCGAGAFHFKKMIGNADYEFDGVPEENVMQGTLVILTKDVKRSGKFYLKK